MKAGRDLDQALHQNALVAAEQAPLVFPALVRLEEVASVESVSSRDEPLAEGNGGHPRSMRPRRAGGEDLWPAR
jgi:hypothetical protein